MAKAPVSQLHCTIQSSQVDTLRELELVKSRAKESDPQPPRAKEHPDEIQCAVRL